MRLSTSGDGHAVAIQFRRPGPLIHSRHAANAPGIALRRSWSARRTPRTCCPASPAIHDGGMGVEQRVKGLRT
jgi:hypothetical protein